MRLKYFRYLLSVIFLFFAGGVQAQSTQTLSMYTWRGSDASFWETINQLNVLPGITIEPKMIIRNSYRDVVLMMLQLGEVDLFLWTPGAHNLNVLVDNNLIRPNEGSLDQISPSALIAAKAADGKFYGIPFAVQMESIMVNKKAARALGITQAPKTIDEFEGVLQKLKDQGVTPLHIAGGETWYISQVLAEVMMAGVVEESVAQGLVNGTHCFDSPEYTLIFELLERWLKRGYLNKDVKTASYSETFTAVSFGSSIMNFEGGWMTSKTEPYYSSYPDYEFDFWAVPGKSAKFYAFGDGTFQVGATSPNREAAERVLAFTGTKQFAELWAKHVQQLPGYGGKIDIEPGDLKKMADILERNAYSESLFNTYSLNKGSPSYNQLVVEAVQGVLGGRLSAKDAADKVQAGLNSWNYIGAQNCQ